MTCDDCVFINKKKTITELLESTEWWSCNKTQRNVFLKIEYNKAVNQWSPSVFQTIIAYDERNEKCKHHKAKSEPLDQWLTK